MCTEPTESVKLCLNVHVSRADCLGFNSQYGSSFVEETGSPLSVAIEPAILHLGVGASGISLTHINISIEPSEEYKKEKKKKAA